MRLPGDGSQQEELGFRPCSVSFRSERFLILEIKLRLAFRHDHKRGIMIHICLKKQDEIQVVISKTFRTSVNGIGAEQMEFWFIGQITYFEINSATGEPINTVPARCLPVMFPAITEDGRLSGMRGQI